uniref:Activating signal cointegrator 1 complex subunit 2 n=1 Tax=Panagrellus redivivus TaxID=6233 RepID=A0A7E4WB47_PANRE
MEGNYEAYDLSTRNFNNTIRDIANRRHFHDLRNFAQLVLDNVFSKSFPLAQINFRTVDIGLLSQLLGFNSEVFEFLCKNEALYVQFLDAIVAQARLVRVSTVVATNSVLYFLVDTFTNSLLPLSDEGLGQLKRTDWFRAASTRTAATGSAFGLLRPQVIASSFAPGTVTKGQHGIDALYLRSNQFSRYLIEGLSDRSTVPSECQVLLLQRIVLHYVSFLVEPANDRDFEAFKAKLRRSEIITKNVKAFFQRWLQGLAWDSLYWFILDFWMCLIFPSDANIAKDPRKMRSFFDLATSNFADLLPVIQERCLNADLSLLSHIRFLERVVTEAFDPLMKKMYDKLGYDVDTFIAEIRDKVTNYRTMAQLCKLEHEQKNALVDAEPNDTSKELDDLAAALDKRLPEELRTSNQSSQTVPETTLNSTVNTSNQSMNVFSPMANSTPLRRAPDFRVDPVTKLLYLSPQGRDQVLKRQASFDFSQCGALLSKQYGSRPFEIKRLAKFLHHFSAQHSDDAFVRYIRTHRHDNIVISLLAKLLLTDPHAPRHVPVYTRKAVAHKGQLDLRFMASWPFVIIAGFVLLSLLNSFLSLFL